MRLAFTCFALVAAAVLAAPAIAYEGPVDKQSLSLPAFTFQDGRTLPLTLGYEPYGPRFPAVAIRDMVETQRAAADSLGIRRWHAVVGASLAGVPQWQ